MSAMKFRNLTKKEYDDVVMCQKAIAKACHIAEEHSSTAAVISALTQLTIKYLILLTKGSDKEISMYVGELVRDIRKELQEIEAI